MVPYNQRLVCLTILLSLFNPWARADFFTAIAEMEPLLKANKRIIEDLDDYIRKEEKRLAVLKNYLEQYKVEHEQAMEDIPNYLGNPINAFILIKRLTTDLNEINDSIKNGTEYINNVSMNSEDVMFPTLEDLAGAVQALVRLQVTYKLDVHDLAEGRLNRVAYSQPMSAADCIELFKILFTKNDYKNSLAWIMETLRKYKEETNKKHSFTEVQVLESIAYVHYKMGDVKTALEWSKKLLKLDPMHPRAAVNVPYFEKAIVEEEAAGKQRGDTGVETKDEKTEPDKLSDEMSDYAIANGFGALCRGEMEINSDVAKRLFCRYMSERHPFLRLAPIKAEQVYIDPDVFVFHGVLSDDEIHTIKVLSTPRFKRAEVYDSTTGKFTFSKYRICKVAWLRDEKSQVVARVSQRVADMTGLITTSAEQLQVANYGIGGYYEPHYDFFEKNQRSFMVPDGNRIATMLFYMSDVALGGSTVFPELGLSVSPARGAALYWRNLHPSGEGDTATRHAACPVLRGSKWVCTKWLRESGQELIQPCNLDYQREDLVRKIPRTEPKSSRLIDAI